MSTLNYSSEITIPSPDKDKPPETYRFAAMGMQVRSNYALYAKTEAWAELDRRRIIHDPIRFRQCEHDLNQDCNLKLYEWGSPLHARIADSRPGIVNEAVARLRVYHPKANEETIERIVDAVGWDRLVMLLNQADGPPPKNESSPAADQATGANPSTTNEFSGTSSGGSQEPTPRPSSG